jgi:hypothetical protein
MYFHDANAAQEADGHEPGWYCSCGYQILTRRDPHFSVKERYRELTERRARVFRKSMVIRAKAARLRQESQRIVSAKRRGKK